MRKRDLVRFLAGLPAAPRVRALEVTFVTTGEAGVVATQMGGTFSLQP